MDGRPEPTPASLSSTRRSGRIGRYGVSGQRVARPRIKTVAPAVLSGGESCDLTLSGEPRAGSQDRVPGARRHCTKILRICAEKLCDLRHRLARTLDNGPEQACRSLRGCASHPPNGRPRRSPCAARPSSTPRGALPLPGSPHDAEVAKLLERASVDRASVMRYRSLGHLLPTGCAACRPPGFLGPVLAHLRAMVLENQIWAQQFSPALVDAAAMTYVGCLR